MRTRAEPTRRGCKRLRERLSRDVEQPRVVLWTCNRPEKRAACCVLTDVRHGDLNLCGSSSSLEAHKRAHGVRREQVTWDVTTLNKLGLACNPEFVHNPVCSAAFGASIRNCQPIRPEAFCVRSSRDPTRLVRNDKFSITQGQDLQMERLEEGSVRAAYPSHEGAFLAGHARHHSMLRTKQSVLDPFVRKSSPCPRSHRARTVSQREPLPSKLHPACTFDGPTFSSSTDLLRR